MNTEAILNRTQEKVETYPTNRAALMSALHAVQKKEGWLSQDTLMEVAESLKIPSAVVKGVATFYSLYRHIPTGRNLIQLCTNVACMIMGADKLIDMLKKEYGLQPGGTSEDGRYSLVVMECIGACGTAPAMLVNDDFHENLDEKTILDILNGYQ